MELFKIESDEVYINIPIKNKGKFRWKNRDNPNEYGIGFSTQNEKYTKKSYVEWQIGYDVETTKIDKKPTNLTDLEFIGANNKLKHPYELSEILYAMRCAGIVSKQEIKNLFETSFSQTVFLNDEYKIEAKETGKQMICDLLCNKQIVSLPTFVYKTEINYSPVIEISIQKQQYASGVQPMLYLSIPLLSMENGEELIGKTSKECKCDYIRFKINKQNKEIIFNIFKLFACCSNKHKHDIVSILKLLESYK